MPKKGMKKQADGTFAFEKDLSASARKGWETRRGNQKKVKAKTSTRKPKPKNMKTAEVEDDARQPTFFDFHNNPDREIAFAVLPDSQPAPTFAKLMIQLPLELAREVDEIVKERKMSWSNYVAVALRSMPKSPTVLFPSTKMPIGKYRDEIALNVAKADPAYIIWMAANVNKVQMSEELLHIAEALLHNNLDLD